MNNAKLSRRTFITSASQLALGGSLFSMVSSDAPIGQSRFTMGLSQYSVRALLRDGSLDPLDFPKFALDEFGIRAIDFWDGGLPKGKIDDPAYMAKLKNNAEAIGSDLFLFMAPPFDLRPNKFTESRQVMLKSLERTKHIGARYMRIFLRVPGEDEAVGVRHCLEALKPLCDRAAKEDITIVIEPGSSTLSTQGSFLARVAREMNHPACRLMPDFGKQRGNVYAGTQAMLPYSVCVSCKMHSFDTAGNQPDFDYPRLMRMISDSEYEGILAIEWEGRELEPIPGVHASKKLIQKSLSSLG
jgi:sugar phosphate isomerase/epimerase